MEPGLETDMYEKLSQVAKAMGNGTRLELLELMAQGEQSVETMARLRDMKLTTVSSHLQILKNAGLVRTRRDGTTIFYRLSGDDVATLYITMKNVGWSHLPGLDKPDFGIEDPWAAIGAEAAVAQVRSGQAFILDVRPHSEYLAGHLPGAVSIPLEELDARVGEVPASKHVVVYCRGEFCELARDAAQFLRGRGISASAMDEGVLEWRASGQVTLADIA